MSSATLQAALLERVRGEVRFDIGTRGLYATDASIYQIIPAAVVVPQSREDVFETVRCCRDAGVSITARGGGTSQAGQAVGAGVQLDFSRYLTQILEFNPDERWVRVEPGIVLDHLNDALKPHHLQVPLDISTSDRATIGGMISNNSAGTRSVLYGKTLDYVLELEVLLADGRAVIVKELDPGELRARFALDSHEGACYRAAHTLATIHADEIARRYPKILRRVGGYNLDELAPGRDGKQKPFNLAKLFVGAEGTLGLILSAKLRLVPLPTARALCVLEFSDLLASLAATPCILEHGPSAVELVDRFILDSTRGKRDYEPLRDCLQTEDPAAVLFVELIGDDPTALPDRLETLRRDLEARNVDCRFSAATTSGQQARIWRLRRAALGLSMSERGDAKAASFVEDTAVSPDRLRDYIDRFQQILAENGTRAGFYAHASVGLLHVRPVVNFKTEEGVATFARVADQIADLVLEFGGALSGEHGDGLARSPFQERMFGPELYRAFCDLKDAFDPQGLFNPGKIVRAPGLTENLRFGPSYQAASPFTLFNFEDFGDMAHAAEQCGGIGECRKLTAGTMCPSFAATRNERDSTRGRANTLRLAISGQLGPEGLLSPAVAEALDLCLECKACKTECPTGVDMAQLKAEALYQRHRKRGTGAFDQLVAATPRIGRWGSGWPALANRLQADPVLRQIAHRFLGLDVRRPLPAFAACSFEQSWRRSHPFRYSEGEKTILFVDTFANYFEPQIAHAAAAMIGRAREPVAPLMGVCCGRPLISRGLLAEARRQAGHLLRSLGQAPYARGPVVFLEPSCFSAVRDDYPNLVAPDWRQAARETADRCVTFEEWGANALHLPTRRAPNAPGIERAVLLHTHCHQRALCGASPSLKLLGERLGCGVTDLDAGCCGMAGSFGYEARHYDISFRVGNHRLFPRVQEKKLEAAVVAAGFSCRHQIQYFTGVRAVHPALFMQSLVDS
jgi:FAD/FMN-containing dehydrogenase/Fe-S oxidoreductase